VIPLPPDGITTDVEELGDIDFQSVMNEVVERAAIRGQVEWQKNLNSGTGASGQGRGKPWRNTGQTIQSIHVEKISEGEYMVGSNLISAAVAEYGRRPGLPPPPFDVIAQWVHEKGISKRGDDDFEGIVNAIRFSIGENGIEGFEPAKQAAIRSEEQYKREASQDVGGTIDRDS